MIPAPLHPQGSDTRSLTVFHDSGRLRTLMFLPAIFKGTITKHDKYVTIYSGKEIFVAFDEPRPLQIDGERVPDVISYNVNR